MQIRSRYLPRRVNAKITLSDGNVPYAADTEARRGLLYALAAYGIWGVAPIYFVWVGFAAPLEILMHRVLWSIPLLLLLITASGQWAAARGLSRRDLLFLLGYCLMFKR